MRELLPWALTAALVVVGLGASAIMRRRSRRDRADWAAQRDTLGQQLDKLAADDRAELERMRARHASEREALAEQIADAQDEAEQTRLFVARSLRWDQVSHDEIVAACSRLEVSGVLASNVIFRPEDSLDRAFVAQIDHVLLTRYGAAVIENKYWKGVIFDGVRPGEVHPTLAALIGMDGLTPPFAIRVTGSAEPAVSRDEPRAEAHTTLKLEPEAHVGASAPAGQVRRQARRLSIWAQKRTTAKIPWFDTCVFYSHAKAVVHAKDVDVAETGARTTIAVGQRGIETFLRGFTARSENTRKLDEEQIAGLTALLAGQGAVITAVGEQAAGG